MLFFAGCAASSLNRDAPTSPMVRGEAWEEAERIAAMGTDRFVAWGAGASMAPVYGSHVILVISRVEFNDLRSGMHVAYSDRAGRIIVHELTTDLGGVWAARGIGNEEADQERVTPENLRGVVYAVFYPEEG